jgi:hypothetical protein
MIEQHILAAKRGIKLRYTVDGASMLAVTPERLAAIQADRERIAADIAKAEAAGYSGGMLQAMALMAAATHKVTAASLTMQYYAAKYSVPASTGPSGTRGAPAVTPPPVGQTVVDPRKAL